MKVSNNAVKELTHKKPIFALRDDEEFEIPKEKERTFQIRTNPKDKDSPTYKLVTFVHDSTEPLRATVRWLDNTNVIRKGLGCDPKSTDTVELLRSLMTGATKDVFNEALKTVLTQVRKEAADAAKAAAQNGAQQQAHDAEVARPIWDFLEEKYLTHALLRIIHVMAPTKALQKQKRYLRRETRKPADMKIREWHNRMTNIINKELTCLP
jgi:hypothetical protein